MTAHVARLCVHGAGRDPIVERLRAERVMQSLDLRPRSLPPEAILCVRELRDPLPGAISLCGHAPPARWPLAMQREVDRIAAAAAWPARGPVPESAEAVAFADEPELLECLALDLLRGMVGRWWWELLTPRHPERGSRVSARFVEAAHAAPAAMARLGERGAAAAFVQALAGPEVRAIAAVVADRFALPLAVAVLTQPIQWRETRIVPSAPRPLPPAWKGVVPETDAACAPELRAFIAVMVAIARAPAVARSERFARETLAFVAPEQRRSEPFRAAPSPPPAKLDRTAPPTDRAAQHESVTPAAEPAHPRDAPPAESPPPDAPAEFQDAVIEQCDAPLLAAVPANEPGVPTTAPLDPRFDAPPAAQKPTHARREFGAGIDTRLGGLFYLFNLALHLSPLPLGPWDFVASAGRRLLLLRPVPWAPIDDDPIWQLLDGLRGPTTDLGFDGWTVPDEWTTLAPYGGLRVPERPELDAWLDCVVPFVEHRLRLAVGPVDDVAAFVLRHEARVHASETELDVVLSLSDLPVDIRLAGLDRDPGWVPSAGRKIAFHFE